MNRAEVVTIPGEFEVMAKEILSLHFVLVAKRKHGKSSSLKTFIGYVKEKFGDRIVIKVFDVSQNWYHCAPVKFRQYVSPKSGPAINIDDCVFEMGELSKEDRRTLVGQILEMDYRDRQDKKRGGGEEAIKAEPLILYVFEEANTYFDSNSLIRKDDYATILNDFVSVGRNYGLGGVLVVTRMVGELAPGIRERSNLLLGRIAGAGELQALRNATNKDVVETVKSINQFHWIFWNGSKFGPFRIRDLVKSVPTDFAPTVEEVAPVEQKRGFWWYLSRVAIVAAAVFMFLKSVFSR